LLLETSLSENVDANWSQTNSLLRYQQGSKSVGISFFFWLFLGGLGAHRFYNRRIASGVALMVLTLLGAVLAPVGVGFILLAISGLWLIVDAFRISGWVDDHNADLIRRIRHGGSTRQHEPLIRGGRRGDATGHPGFRPPIIP
jgi:TM2 domain-containing membrane protein YozV